MAEWLGNGLQNHVHRFESGSDLNETQAKAWVFLFYVDKELLIG